MKAIAVTPKVKDSVRLVEMDEPRASDIPNGRGVLVEILRVGACGTDREINHGEYGISARRFRFSRARTRKFRARRGNRRECQRAAKRRFCGRHRAASGGKVFMIQSASRILRPTTNISSAAFHACTVSWLNFTRKALIFSSKFRPPFAEIAVLLEPLSIIEKGLKQASDIQERLKIWRPKTAAVLGTGNVGLLTVLALRLRGYEVHGFGKDKRDGYLNAELCEAIGATYDSTMETSVVDSIKKYGEYDLIFECTGFSPIVFDAMQSLNQNGVLILASVTGGERKTEVPSDKINQQFVLGNRVDVRHGQRRSRAF